MISVGIQRAVRLGIRSLLLHKLRSALTTLGVLFGVSSVIAMLAIGEGASEEAVRARLGEARRRSSKLLARAQDKRRRRSEHAH